MCAIAQNPLLMIFYGMCMIEKVTCMGLYEMDDLRIIMSQNSWALLLKNEEREKCCSLSETIMLISMLTDSPYLCMKPGANTNK